jgi:TrmH family RNA methyltransferase
MRKEIYDLLNDKKGIKKGNYIVIDTEKILEEVVNNKIEIRHFLYSDKGTDILKRFKDTIGGKAEKVKGNYIDKFASVKTHQNFLAIAVAKERKIEKIEDKGILILLDNIQDPANMGAIIRSGAAFGFKDYLFLNCAYIFSEKAIRSSAGAVFLINHNDINQKDLQKLKKEFKILITDVDNGENVKNIKEHLNEKAIIVFGNEGGGVTPAIKSIADYKVKIEYPEMRIDSLNVAASAAIVFYECSLRQ